MQIRQCNECLGEMYVNANEEMLALLAYPDADPDATQFEYRINRY